MKTINGDELLGYPVGTVFVELLTEFDPPSMQGMPKIIYSTFENKDYRKKEEESLYPQHKTLLYRVEDLIENPYPYKSWDVPYEYTGGTQSAGCYNGKERLFVVLDKADVQKICERLLNPKVVGSVVPGHEQLENA